MNTRTLELKDSLVSTICSFKKLLSRKSHEVVPSGTVKYISASGLRMCDSSKDAVTGLLSITRLAVENGISGWDHVEHFNQLQKWKYVSHKHEDAVTPVSFSFYTPSCIIVTRSDGGVPVRFMCEDQVSVDDASHRPRGYSISPSFVLSPNMCGIFITPPPNGETTVEFAELGKPDIDSPDDVYKVEFYIVQFS